MVNDAAAVALLMKALGYGIPAAVMAFMFLVFSIYMRFQKAKGDKDRAEHMKKWESLIATNRDAVIAQKETTTELIDAHEKEMVRIIEHHRKEIERMFGLYERQTKGFEVMAHNLTVITEKLEQRDFCPNQKRE